jgi:hypothetical protein
MYCYCLKLLGGLKKDALYKNKNGRIVSKKASAKGKANKWIKACVAARKALGVKGFSVIIANATSPHQHSISVPCLLIRKGNQNHRVKDRENLIFFFESDHLIFSFRMHEK